MNWFKFKLVVLLFDSQVAVGLRSRHHNIQLHGHVLLRDLEWDIVEGICDVETDLCVKFEYIVLPELNAEVRTARQRQNVPSWLLWTKSS